MLAPPRLVHPSASPARARSSLATYLSVAVDAMPFSAEFNLR